MVTRVDISNNKPIIYCMSATILIVICVISYSANLFDIGFTTYDDFTVSLWRKSNLIAIADEKAINQGRFSHYIIIPLTYVPFIVNNMGYYHTMTMLPVLACYAAFIYFISKLIRNCAAVIYLAAFYIVNMQNSWDHNPITSYPFILPFVMTCLLISFVFYYDYMSSNKGTDLATSVLLYAVSLIMYESVVFYLLVYVVLEIYCAQKARIKRLLPFAVVTLLYLLAYAVFRYYNPSQYKGTMISGFDFDAFLNVLAKFSLSSFPPFKYFTSAGLFNRYLDIPGVHEWSLHYLLENSRPLWFIEALLFGFVTFYFLSNVNSGKLPTKTFVPLTAISIILLFVPNILIAVTPKYQQWAASGCYGYHTAYFSYFGAVLFVGIALMKLFETISNNRTKALAALVTAICFGIVVICVNYSNHYYFKSQKLANLRLSTFNKIVGSTLIEDKSLIYSPSLCSQIYQHGIFKNDPIGYTYQSRVNLDKDVLVTKYDNDHELNADFQQIYGKYIKEFSAVPINDRKSYFIKYIEEYKNYNSAAVIVEGKPFRDHNKFTILNNSNYKKMHVSARLTPNVNAIIKVNTETLIVQNGKLDSFIEFTQRDSLSIAEITSLNGNIDIDSISMSFI